MKFLRSKMLFGTGERRLRTPVRFFSHSLISYLFLFNAAIISCTAGNSEVLLKDLKTGSYDFFLKADNAAYRRIKKMGRNSAYYVGLHLKQAGHGQAARFYFTLGERLYETPFNSLCRNELYETGAAADRLQSVEKRLQELARIDGAAVQEEKERLKRLKIRLLLQAEAYDKIETAPDVLYLTDTLTAELVTAFPQLAKDMPPFRQKLAECRVRIFEKRYEEAWDAVETAFGMEHELTGLAFPALLSDIGRAGLYGTNDAAGAAAFFENSAEHVRAAKEPFDRGEERRYLFYALFYAARCRNRIGKTEQRERAAKLFMEAAEQADTDSGFDSALWYYLDTLRMLGAARYIQALAETAARWKNPAWYGDLVQSLQAQLTAAKDWKRLRMLHEALGKTNLPNERAAVAYTLARSGSLSEEQAARFLQEAAGETHDTLYYRILSAYRLGEKTMHNRAFLSGSGNLRQPNTAAQNRTADAQKQEKCGFTSQEAHVYIGGLLHFGLYSMVYPQIIAVYPSIPAEEAIQIASELAAEKRYADSMRVARLSLKNEKAAPSEAQLKLLYPRPWQDIVTKYAAEYRLPEYLLYALIRSESFFQPTIVSGAGAVGLTQLMPATAADIAKKLKITDYRLTDPEINIRFGAYYLAEMIRRSDNRIMPACFAYNAGISRVRGWQKKAQDLSGDLFLESLEYAETRDYGRKMLSAAAVYGSLYYSEKPEDIVRLFFPI